MEDASYLKLSNVTLGYTFPKNLIARVGLKNLRLYLSLIHIFEFPVFPDIALRQSRNAVMHQMLLLFG